ncbi:unnamed protein product [Effrenium voratum]|nr:unnamed protein product [Effrenium voratum]
MAGEVWEGPWSYGTAVTVPGVPQGPGDARSAALKRSSTAETFADSVMDGMDDTSPAHPGMDSLEKQQAPTVEHVDSGGSVPDLFEELEMIRKAAHNRTQFAPTKVPLVESNPFALMMGGVVIINAILIGVEVDLGAVMPLFFIAANLSFLFVYMAELGLRFLTFGSGVFTDPLTVLDMVLIVLVFIEQFAFPGSLARSLPAFRLLRLLRLLRTLRYLKASAQLLAFVSNSVRTIKTLGWVTFILFVLLWAVAACMHHVIGKSAIWNESYVPWQEFEAFMTFDNREYFGSVTMSFLSTLQVVTTAQWANHIARPILFRYPITAGFFGFFLLTTTYGLLACVVANIVQDAIETSRLLEASNREVEREHRQIAGVRARALLRMVDEDNNGELDEKELAVALENEEFIETLLELEVPILSAEGLVLLFDKKGRGFVSFDALVNGLVSMLDDIEEKDMFLMSIWSEGLILKAGAAEQRCERLCRGVQNLRFQLEHMNASWRQFFASREATTRHYRAMKHIRTAPPPMPVSIYQILNIKVKEEIPEDESEAFISFARRYVGFSSRNAQVEDPPPPTGAVDVAKALVSRKSVLPPAPLPSKMQKALYMRDEITRKAHDTRYDIDGRTGAASKRFKELQETLRVDPELLE